MCCGWQVSVASRPSRTDDPPTLPFGIAKYRYRTTSDRALDSADDGLAPAAALFRSLGDPAGLAIVRRLAEGEARVVDLVACLDLAQSTVSAHLACLRDCGLVVFRPQGRASYYFLACPDLLDLLTAAEAVLAATGSAVALCPVNGATPSEVGAG